MALAVVVNLGGLDNFENQVGILFLGDFQFTLFQDFDYLIDFYMRFTFYMTKILQKYLKKNHGY